MTIPPANETPGKPKLPIQEQVSAGGVAYRSVAGGIEVALISVGSERRWQLPKGTVEAGETPDVTAIREVQEETGLATELKHQLMVIEYWYVGSKGRQRFRFHKFVHFFLLKYLSGEVTDHDREVNEARWVPLEQARQMLTFKNERQALEKAAELVAAM